MSTKEKLKTQLDKYKNIVSIYFTPKNQMWGILSDSKKKCIIKKIVDKTELHSFLKSKNIISYEDSKVVKKAKVSFINKSSIKNSAACSRLVLSKDTVITKSILDNANIKKEFGQFYSVNCDYIFKGMIIPKSVNLIIEPFGGSGELLKWIYKKTNISAESYDIMPKFNSIIKRDVFKDIPAYKGKFVITNPPYLSKNKTKNKSIFDLYKTDDLYKCFLLQLLNDPCLGGILIVPLNFFCSFRKKDLNLRKRFLGLYEIISINIFEKPVFSDTSYTICSFMFRKKVSFLEIPTKISMYPSNFFFSVVLNNKNYYSFSGNILNLSKSTVFTIQRLTKLNFTSQYATNIVVQCIDNKKKINALVVDNESVYIDNTKHASARSYLSLLIKPKVSLVLQKKLVTLFNDFFNEKRKEFYSLFLSQYRELDRKRISFDLVYSIFSYLLKTYI